MSKEILNSKTIIILIFEAIWNSGHFESPWGILREFLRQGEICTILEFGTTWEIMQTKI